jgi:hypothetical protein
MPPTLKLIYFDYPAKAEAIRLAFHIGHITFDDCRLERETFHELRAAGKFKVGRL